MRTAATGIIFVCLSTSLAMAQSDDKLDDVNQFDALAKKAFIEYQNKNYGKAIFHWRKALQIQDVALLHHSIAKAYEKQGELKSALKYARRAKLSKATPLTAKYQKKNDRLIARLEKAIAIKHAQERQAKIDATRYQLDWRGYTGIGTATVGLVALGLMGYENNQAKKGLEQLQPPQKLSRKQYNDLKDKVESHQSRGQLYFYAGMGLMTLGTGLFLWDFLTVDEDVDMSASIMPGGVSVTVRF